MIRRPPRSTLSSSSAASDVYKRQRYLYMKQHSAQHLISGILYNKFSIDTLSVHLSETYIAIETGEPIIDIQTIYDIEDEVNKAIIHGGKTHTQIITCLLYTSPSPRDRQKSRMPSSA
eukprot:TRINITY_DN7924_c0_g1_i2.p2 TRINITY_DN7924_c0_g1~~TRINITY_DN7924_c0_g1_i2.p2  ORF type:complete len:118 (+),score=15.65 TRINITY_DN7924_c0_g1_i2:96-449(+)